MQKLLHERERIDGYAKGSLISKIIRSTVFNWNKRSNEAQWQKDSGILGKKDFCDIALIVSFVISIDILMSKACWKVLQRLWNGFENRHCYTEKSDCKVV